PVWSTTTLPNSATTGDLLYASANNVYSNRAAVATGQVLISQGTSTAPVWSGAPTLTAGTGTATYKIPGTLYWEFTNTSNGADTIYAKTAAYQLPLNTGTTAGDRVILDCVVLGDNTAKTITYKCNIGYSSFNTSTGAFTGGTTIISTSTTQTNQSIHVTANL